MDADEQKIKYDQLLADHIKEIPGKMYTFEVTKCCFYSSFVYRYKDERIIDLYSKVSQHFGTTVLSLYILTADNRRIQVPINGQMSVREFVNKNTEVNNRNLTPVYGLPMPVVYRIYYDDGFHCDQHNA
jgi:hypothetical protein